MFLLLIFLASNILVSHGQKKYWSLEDCIAYANQNNVSVQQSEVQTRMNQLQLEQSKASQLPTLNASTNFGGQFGRSIDPTSNSFINSQIAYQSIGVQTGATLFNWFRLKNTIKANELELQASEYTTDKLKNDISLNVIAFLIELFAHII